MTRSVDRALPKMMTVTATMAGLLPMLWSTGVGSEIMQCIAVPLIDGMVSSILLTPIVIPVLFTMVYGAKTRAPVLQSLMSLGLELWTWISRCMK